MATRRTQGMSPATSLMGAARQFGKVGARGSGNKSVQPGGKNKPVPGLSPSTNPRIQGVQKMPEPMRPAGAAVYPGGLPKFPTGGAQVKPAVGVGPQPVQRGQAKFDQSHAAPLTGRQRKIVKRAVRNAPSIEGSTARLIGRRLRKGIRSKGISNREQKAINLAKLGISKGYKNAKTTRRAKKWARRYKRAQG